MSCSLQNEIAGIRRNGLHVQPGCRILSIVLVFCVLFMVYSVSALDESRVLIVRGDDNYPPYEYIDENGQPAGFSIEVFRAVAETMDLEYNLTLGTWSEVRAELESGRIDVLADMARSEDRARLVDFSVPYDTKSAFLYIRTGSSIRDPEDLKGKKILVEKSDIAEDYLISRNFTSEIVPFASKTDALLALSHGQGDAAIVSKYEAVILTDKYHITNVEPAGPPLYEINACFAVRKGDAALLAQLNEGLTLIKQSGTYDRIYLTWFGVYEERSFYSELVTYSLVILLPVAGLFVLIGVWSWSLKRQVAIKTSELKFENDRGKARLAELRKSEKRFREIFDNSNDAIYLVALSEDGSALRFIEVNRRAREMLGYSDREFLEMTPRDIHDPSTVSDVLNVSNELTDRNHAIIRTNHRAKDGRIIPVELSIHRFTLGTENVNLIIARDITERKLAEDALKRSERRLADIINFLPDATLVIDRDGIIIAWNKAMEEMTGVPAGQMLGKGNHEYAIPFYGLRRPILIDMVFASDAVIDRNQYHIIRKEGDLIVAETDLPTPLGKAVTLWVKTGPLYDDAGNVIGAIESIRDVTERKQAERALQQSEDKYRTLFEHSGSPLMIVDEDTTILLVNREFAHLTGYGQEEIEGRKHWTEFIADNDDREMMMEYHRLRRIDPALAPVSYESKVTGRKGAIRNVIITSAMIPGTRQSISALVDITDRKRAEDELKRLYSELEQRIAERTVDLRQAEDAFRQANAKLNLLSSITRHDILNQLMALNGFLELMQKKICDDGVADYLKKARLAAATIERHILFTKLYQDIGVKSPAWQNVGKCVEKSVTDLLPASVTCTQDLDETEIYADPLFEKVIYTLIDNSLMHGEHVTEIRFSYRMTDTGALVLVCEDNGSGVRAEDKERIFERGFGKHTGFGLFLAREILTITGITIAETGEPGRGARFEIIVPEGAFRFTGA